MGGGVKSSILKLQFRTQADVRDYMAMEEAVAQTIENLGQIDIVVSNAGAVAWIEMTPDHQQIVLDVNLTGTFNKKYDKETH
ncbi:MAG: SDR family NAD(P)-dependent oxidoreductase [Chloroflexota bacterium]